MWTINGLVANVKVSPEVSKKTETEVVTHGIEAQSRFSV